VIVVHIVGGLEVRKKALQSRVLGAGSARRNYLPLAVVLAGEKNLDPTS